MTDYTQFGIAGLTLGILFIIVKYFIEAINKKDAELITLIKDFNITISNHMTHENEAFRELTDAIRCITKKYDQK